jgi:hypothetical protein
LAVLGFCYAIGFVVVNAHMGRFRPLEYDLLEARYLAAALLFVGTSVPPMVLMLFAFGIIHQPPHGVARSWPRWKLWSLRGLRCLVGIFTGYMLWGFLLDGASISTGFKRTGTAISFYLWLAFICMMWELSALLRKYDPAPEYLRHLDPQFFLRLVMTGVVAFGAVVLFGINIFPNLQPGLGGGGAWEATVLPEPDALPPALLARIAPDVVILEQDDDDVSLLLCPVKPEDAPPPVVIARDKLVAIMVGEVVAVGDLEARCADPRRATPAAPAPAAGQTSVPAAADTARRAPRPGG